MSQRAMILCDNNTLVSAVWTQTNYILDNIIKSLILLLTNNDIVKLSCKYHIRGRRTEKKCPRQHCSADTGHCFALRHCRHSRLQAVGQKRRAPGRLVKRMAPEGSWFISTISTQSGLCIRFSRDTLLYLQADWKRYFVNSHCNIAAATQLKTSDILNRQLRCSRASYDKAKLEHTNDRHPQMGLIVLQNFTRAGCYIKQCCHCKKSSFWQSWKSQSHDNCLPWLICK